MIRRLLNDGDKLSQYVRHLCIKDSGTKTLFPSSALQILVKLENFRTFRCFAIQAIFAGFLFVIVLVDAYDRLYES